MENPRVNTMKRTRKWAWVGIGFAGIGAGLAIALSSGWVISLPTKLRWPWWSYWVCVGLSVLAIVTTYWTYARAPEKRNPQLIVMRFMQGNNPQPVLGLVTFILLVYSVGLVSSLVQEGAVWWRVVAAICATLDVSLCAILVVLRGANRELPTDQLQQTPVLIYPLSMPGVWTINDVQQAPATSLLMNEFPDPSKIASINVLFVAAHFHARKLREVHILVTKEVADKYLLKQGIHVFDNENPLQVVLQGKVREVVQLVEGAKADAITVTVHKCETGNNLVRFRESVERELSQVLRENKSTPGHVTFELTNGTALITAALLLTAIKYDGCQAEYIPQTGSEPSKGATVPQSVPTTINSIYDLAGPLMKGIGSE